MWHRLEAPSAMTELPSGEEVLASAIHFLMQGDTEEDLTAADLLLSSQLQISDETNDFGEPYMLAELRGPRKMVESMNARTTELGERLELAIRSIVPVYDLTFRVLGTAIALQPGWRGEAQEQLHSRRVTNQGVGEPLAVLYDGLRFRSNSELAIYKELDRRGLLFLPNCAARVSAHGRRLTREPDFLVSCNGKWGILEVDGPHHTPEKAAREHERDRLFRVHGITVERYESLRCFHEANEVVDDFLTVLERS